MAEFDQHNPPEMPQGTTTHVTNKVRRQPLTSGDVFEIRDLDSVLLTPDGSSRSDTLHDDGVRTVCGCIISDPRKLVQCQSCHGLACRELHAVPCRGCGLWVCVRCRQTVQINGQGLVLCPGCAEAATTPRIVRLVRNCLWGI